MGMIFNIRRFLSRSPSPVAEQDNSTLLPSVPDFADLEHNFGKRCWSFAQYKELLSPDNLRLLHWHGSIDYSGFQREESLQYLIDHFQPGDENRILLRLEDWVTPIATLAEQWTLAHFEDLSLTRIDKQHRLLLYLARKERLAGSKALLTINAWLVNRATVADDQQFYQLNSNLRKYIYRLVSCRTPLFRKRILHDPDPQNRIILLQQFRYNQLTEEEINLLKTDKSSFVIRNLLLHQLEAMQTIDRADLLSHCLNRNRGIRQLAAFYLLRDYDIDACEIYKKQPEPACYYIADYARKEDTDFFLNGYQSSNRDIKILCVKAICTIDFSLLKGMDPQPWLSENRKIRQQARQYLPRILSIEELLDMKDAICNTNRHSNLRYLKMVYRKSFWHFVNEALTILQQLSDTIIPDTTIRFIKNLYYARPYIYQSPDTKLKTAINNNVVQLKTSPNNSIQDFLQRISFDLKEDKP